MTKLDLGKNMSIGKKLVVGFGFVSAILVMLTMIGFFNMRWMDYRFGRVINSNTARMEKANGAVHALDQIFCTMGVLIMAEERP